MTEYTVTIHGLEVARRGDLARPFDFQVHAGHDRDRANEIRNGLQALGLTVSLTIRQRETAPT